MKKLYAFCAASLLMLSATAQAETIELTANLTPSTMMFQPGMGGWSFEFNDVTDSYTICTLIEGADFTGESVNELVGTYTIDNLSPYLSFITDPSFMLWVTFVDATITVEPAGNGLAVNMEILGDDSNTYLINATYATQAVVEEKDVDFGNNLSIKYFEADGDWYIQAHSEEYDMNLDILSPELDGTYSTVNFVPTYTFVDDLVNQQKYLYIIDAEVTFVSDENGSDMSGWVTLETGVKLNIKGRYVDNTTGIETVAQDVNECAKFMQDGRMIIRHQGVSYGVDGVRIK